MAVRTVDLRYVPRPWQVECHRINKRFEVLALHRRAGKTKLAIAKLSDKALNFALPDGKFYYIAPFLKQAKAIAWVMLKQHLAPLIELGIAEVFEGELSIRFVSNGATIRLYGADNPDAIRGVHLDGVVIDEVAQMDPSIWHDIVQPCLADRLGWALFIGTPKGVNLFSELYFGASRDPENWGVRRYTVYDTHALDPKEVARLRVSMSPTAFAREMLCDFAAQADDQLISMTDVETACARHLHPGEFNFAPRIMGVDPARFGNDRSVIVRRQGLLVLPPIVLHGIDNVALGNRVLAEKLAWQADAIFCDEGQGAGVIDYIRSLHHDIVGVHFGGKANKAIYHDKRSEMWCEMADWIAQAALPGTCEHAQDMKRDLAAPTYSFTPQGKRKLESKDELKARGIPSPDIGDALAITFAQPVAPRKYDARAALRAMGIAVTTGVSDDPYSRQPRGDYDPYDPSRMC